MKEKFISAYMDVAERFARLSTATRLQVGAIIVKDDRIISIGYNGTPAGWNNDCEVKEYMNKSQELCHSQEEIDKHWPGREEYIEEYNNKQIKSTRRYRLTTKKETIHAEANAIAKLAKGNESGKDSVMFLTHSPCIDCAKQIFTAGINKVYFREQYRSTEGIKFLEKCNVEVEQCNRGDTI